MDEAAIYDRLTEIIRDLFDDDSIAVTPDLTANEVDGWDSLTHVRLMLTIEKAFKVKFTTSEIGNMETVGDLVKVIKQRIQTGTSQNL
jgi:acyl carrier protein